MSNILTTRELDLYREAAKAQLQTAPTGTPAAMLAVLEATDLAQKYERYDHVVSSLKRVYLLKEGIGGGVVSLDTLTSGGTDYTVGQDLPISESGSDGVGASATVATIDGSGAILTLDIVGGSSYDTPVLDLTAGTVDAVITLQATTYGAFDDEATLDDMLALI